ncbi:MAG: hypothetical protein FWG88_06255 [Oscillospiraceae bacterium]|nr:hypothetical protein [Oscillospiraceae bacterium]
MIVNIAYFSLLMTAAMLMLLPSIKNNATAFIKKSIPSNGNIDTAGLYDITDYVCTQPVNITVNGVGLTGTNDNLALVLHKDTSLTLRDASIKCSKLYTAPIRVSGLNCKLILLGENSVISENNFAAGINVPPDTSLLIEGSGSLYCEGNNSTAGIGGNCGQNTGEIIIIHVKVYANSCGYNDDNTKGSKNLENNNFAYTNSRSG